MYFEFFTCKHFIHEKEKGKKKESSMRGKANKILEKWRANHYSCALVFLPQLVL